MKAVLFNEPGDWSENLRLRELEIRDPAPNEIQVKIIARPVNPSDQMFISGTYRVQPDLPQVAGLEGAGVIEKVGQNLSDSLVGAHVSFWNKGSWAEKINLLEDNYRTVPEAIPFEIACQLSLNSFTAYALLEQCSLATGQWLIVSSANSSVCRQIIQLASAKQINVLAICRNESFKNELLELGASEYLNSDHPFLERKILDITQGGGHAVLDAVGGELATKLIQVAAPFAKLIIYGALARENASFQNKTIVYNNLKIEGFGIRHWLNSKSERERGVIWDAITTAVSTNTLKLHFNKTFPLEHYKDAIKHYLNTGEKTILI